MAATPEELIDVAARIAMGDEEQAQRVLARLVQNAPTEGDIMGIATAFARMASVAGGWENRDRMTIVAEKLDLLDPAQADVLGAAAAFLPAVQNRDILGAVQVWVSLPPERALGMVWLLAKIAGTMMLAREGEETVAACWLESHRQDFEQGRMTLVCHPDDLESQAIRDGRRRFPRCPLRTDPDQQRGTMRFVDVDG